MSNVVSLPKREPERVVWVCGCGCTNHYHHADGTVECASCETVATEATGEWRSRLPDTPADPPELAGTNFKVLDLGSSVNWVRRLFKEAHTIVLGTAIFADGSMSTFTGEIDTKAQREWAERKLAEARSRLIKD